MTITAEQRTYARLAGILFLLNYVLQGVGDGITIQSRGSASFVETARWAAESPVLYRVALAHVAAAWIAIGILAVALYAVLEPVNRRLAQLALALRLGASFVGAASVMFRVAQARLYLTFENEGLFTTEQLRALVAVSQRAAGAGVTTAWMFLGAGSMLSFLLFLRSRYLPGALARVGVFASALMVVMSLAMFVVPERTNELKALGLPVFLTEVVTALWLLIKGLHPRATAAARA